MADAFAPRSMKRRNMKNLVLSAPAPKPPPPPPPPAEVAPDDDQLEVGIGYNPALRAEDLEMLDDLGEGNGGSVTRVRHKPTGTIMARKAIHVGMNKQLREKITERELKFMRKCNSEYIVTFYGALAGETQDIYILMECADVGSLDKLSQTVPFQVDVLGKVAVSILGGLTYLYATHHIMHRDIKPSNVLINSQGQIKLCDFGVSGEAVNSVADTFVGTSTYMAPERIQGETYTIRSDVWSFGLTIMELAIGRFPFPVGDDDGDDDEGGPSSIFDLLQRIVNEDPPTLPPSDAFPAILDKMLANCLNKNPKDRPSPQELFDHDPFVQAGKRTPVDIMKWIPDQLLRVAEAKRLQQLAHTTEDIDGATEPPLFQTITAQDGNERYMQTPTSGEIPIAGSVLVSPQDQHVGPYTSISDRPEFSPLSAVYARQQPQLSPQQSYHQQPQSPPAPRSAGLFYGKPGRTSGPDVHPGLGSRTMTTDSVPVSKPRQQLHQTYHGHDDIGVNGGREAARFYDDQVEMPRTTTAGSVRATRTPFVLPVRPPPPPKETREEMHQRRQAQF